MKLPAKIACLIALPVAFAAFSSSASAATGLVVAVEPTTITGSSGFFDVVVTNDTASPIDISDTSARVYQDTVNPNIIFGIPVATTAPDTAIHSTEFFTPYGSNTNTASDVSDNYSGGIVSTLDAGATFGLMRVPVTVLNNYSGTLLVDVSTDEFAGTSLLNGTGDADLDYTPVSGTITFAAVPEPASLSLLVFGGAALLVRRRRGSR